VVHDCARAGLRQKSAEHTIRKFALRAQSFSRTGTSLKLLPDALPFGVGLRAEHGQRRWGAFHVLLGGMPGVRLGRAAVVTLIAPQSVSRLAGGKSDWLERIFTALLVANPDRFLNP